MKKETIRALDLFLGKVLCGGLTLHRRLFEGGSDTSLPPPQRILFIKLIEQGATVLAHDAIRRAAEKVGRDNVFFCVFEENRPILDVMELIPPQNVFVIRGNRPAWFFQDAWSVIQAIRQANIDVAIDMEFFSRASAIIAYLSGARRRIGLHRFREEGPYRGDLMTHRLVYNALIHTARAYSLLVDALDADPGDSPMLKIPVGPPAEPPVPFRPSPAETERVQSILDEVAGRRVDRPIVVLNPNTGDLLPLRRWPTERFIELGRRIVADYPAVTLVITGAPSEAEAADAVCRALSSPRAISIAGRTTLREVLVLYTLATAMVTNDSGPGHFATLTAIENIVLFGPGAPSQFGPIAGHHHVLWANLACSPCVNVYNHRFSTCTNNVCMQAITVDQVYAKVRVCLGSPPP